VIAFREDGGKPATRIHTRYVPRQLFQEMPQLRVVAPIQYDSQSLRIGFGAARFNQGVYLKAESPAK
jgi:hypothetical protein